MKYCYLVHFKPEWESQRIQLLSLYNDNIEKIAEILGVPKTSIPRGIILKLVQTKNAHSRPASYIKECGTIEYRFTNDNEILTDNGKLIHEATHVVQDYPVGIVQGHPCWCWMEGIADYCRFKLDTDFSLDNFVGDPLKGFRYTANFLLWLSEEYDDFIIHINKLIREQFSLISDPDYIFVNLLDKPYLSLLGKYKKNKKTYNSF